MIRFLASFCREHVLDEKVFVCPSFLVGRQVGEALARETGSWINLRFTTLAVLAQEIGGPALVASNRRPLSSRGARDHFEGLFRALHEQGKLGYFGRAAATPGVIEALYRALETLRLAGLRSTDLAPGDFILEDKGRALVLLLSRYEESLAAAGVLDRAGLYAFALDVLKRQKKGEAGPGPQTGAGPFVLCLRDHPCPALGRELIAAAAGPGLILVPRGDVVGLERPRHFWPAGPPAVPAPGAAASDLDRLPWLFAPEAAPHLRTPAPTGAAKKGRPRPERPGERPGALEIFRAVGPANECREILRRIFGSGTPLDEVEIVHPPGLAHPSLFHLLAARAGLPVTFDSGIPLAFTAPGRVFLGLLAWLENDYQESYLRRLLETGDLSLQGAGRGAGDAPSARTVARLLTEASIGWGRERYLPRLEALRRAKEADLKRARKPREEEEDAGEGGLESLERELREVVWLQEAVRRLLERLPEPTPPGPADFAALCSGLAGLVETCASVNSEFDREAAAGIGSQLREAACLRAEADAAPLRREQALDRLRSSVSGLTVGKSAPRAGRLHLSSFTSGGYSGRPVTFICGLDQGSFPGRGLQDPVLLDEERLRISEGLATTADALREDLYGMASLLASLGEGRGEGPAGAVTASRVTLSYSSFEVDEGRPCFPSSLILQAFRLMTANSAASYSDLERGLAEASGFLPEAADKACDPLDWWLAKLSREGLLLDGSAAVFEAFPDLKQGHAAAEARASSRLTEYEGVVHVDPAIVDPRRDPQSHISPTRLETLAECPRRFFLRYLLGIERPEALEYDPSAWLDPLQRGTLLHDVLCELMREVVRRAERLDRKRHAALARETAEKALAEWKDEIPPPSARIYEKERRELLESLDVFFNVESGRGPEVEPLYFEKELKRVPLGFDGKTAFRLSGYIDRVDRVGPGLYRIIDYKSGSLRKFEKVKAFGHGRVLQHALYALAVEEVLPGAAKGQRARVVESGYLFPTRRGEGREVMIGSFDRAALRRLLDDLLDILAHGYFVPRSDDPCDFCDYAAVCGNDYGAFVKDKRDENPKVFEVLDKLKNKDYE
jgi:RecB family exonuclease